MEPAYIPLLALLLLMIGLALLAAEIFIPSGGLLLVAAVICISGSIWFGWQAWGQDSRPTFWIFIGSIVFLLPMTVGAAFYVLPRTSFGRRILLEAPSLEEVTPYAEEEQHLMQMVGLTGNTLTMLNPGGLVLVENERMHCESEGVIIEQGELIKVVAVKGNRLVVRRTAPDESAAEPLAEADAPDQPPLDFDLPQS